MRPIIVATSYHLSKYFAKLLSLITQSEHTEKNTKEFIEQFKNTTRPENSKLVSFDVSSLFTNAPFDNTIDIILRRVYSDKETNTRISRGVIKELLWLCTKNFYFFYNGQLYSQTDNSAMGLPLGP